MSVKGTDPKPKHFARTSWGSPPGVPEELEQAKNSPKHFQTAETGSEQPKASSEQPKALPKCQNGAPKGSGPGFGSKRVFQMVPEGNFNRQLQSAKLPNSVAPKGSGSAQQPKTPSKCHKVAPKGSGPGSGPKWLFPNGSRRTFNRQLQRAKVPNPAAPQGSRPGLAPPGPRPGFGRRRLFRSDSNKQFQ